jgi:aminoglycoside 2''-phosphotransferase
MQEKILLQKIKKEFPKLQWNSFELITKGWDFDVIILDKKIAFRFPREEDTRRNIRKEIQLLKYLNPRLQVKTPQYRYIAKDKSFVGYQFLCGKPLTLSKYRKLTAKQKQLLIKQLAMFLSSLHSTPSAIFKKYNIRKGNSDKSFEWLVNDTEKYVFPKLNKKEVKYINEHFEELKSSLNDTYQPVLVHGDLTSSNLLWDNQSNSLSIIDFSDHHIGDPANDFSGLLIYGETFVKKILSLYKGSKDENLLNRAKLNYKSTPLVVMKGGLCGAPETFKVGHKMFRERFRL